MVKCAKCGFLALRNKESRGLEEAEESYREGVALPLVDGGVYYRHESRPLCFTRNHDLRNEVREEEKKEEAERRNIGQVIEADRKCEAFTEWQQGFTPKEHREMLDRQWVIEYQERREMEDKKWREQQEDRQRAWMGKQGKQRFRWEIIIFGGVVTLALIGGQIVAALIQRSILFP